MVEVKHTKSSFPNVLDEYGEEKEKEKVKVKKEVTKVSKARLHVRLF